MKITVAYYMKGEGKQYSRFDTFKEAKFFMQWLAINPDCEAYGIERNI